MVEFSRGGVQRLDCVDTAAKTLLILLARYQFNLSYQFNVCTESCETGPKECEPLWKSLKCLWNPLSAAELIQYDFSAVYLEWATELFRHAKMLTLSVDWIVLTAEGDCCHLWQRIKMMSLAVILMESLQGSDPVWKSSFFPFFFLLRMRRAAVFWKNVNERQQKTFEGKKD